MQSKTHIVTTITQFIDEVKKEFPETNLEYLNFSAGRFIEKHQPLSEGKSAEEISQSLHDELYDFSECGKDCPDLAIIKRHLSQLQPPKEKEYVLPSDELLRKAFEAGRDSEFDPDINATVFLYDTFDKWLSSLKE